MAESIILAKFNVESEAYEAFSEVKKAFMAPEFMISQACVVKKENGQILMKDRFDTGIESTNDTRFGGIMGMLIGFLAGPLGILLGGGMEGTGEKGCLKGETGGHILFGLLLLLLLLPLLLLLMVVLGSRLLFKVLTYFGLCTTHLLHEGVHIDLDGLTGTTEGG